MTEEQKNSRLVKLSEAIMKKAKIVKPPAE